jgi:hypothetical protein
MNLIHICIKTFYPLINYTETFICVRVTRMMVARVNDLESRAKSYLKKVMLNTTFDKLVKHVKKRNKKKSNNDKIIFYTFKTLNIQFTKKKFIIICLTSTPGTMFSIFF